MKRFLAIFVGITALAVVGYAWACGTKTSGGGCGGGAQASGDHMMHQAAATETVTDSALAYPIDYCVVSGEKLGGMGDPVKYDYKGRTVMFCCNGCVKKFEAEPAKYIAALDAAVAATNTDDAARTTSAVDSTGKAAATASVAAKPVAKLEKLDWCVVSGEKLGEMGKPVPYKYKGREVTLCCKGCIKQFDKNPTAYMARLDSALAGQIKQPMPVQEEQKSEGGRGGM